MDDPDGHDVFEPPEYGQPPFTSPERHRSPDIPLPLENHTKDPPPWIAAENIDTGYLPPLRRLLNPSIDEADDPTNPYPPLPPIRIPCAICQTLLDIANATQVEADGSSPRAVRVLGCGHLFCSTCIEGYLDTVASPNWDNIPARGVDGDPIPVPGRAHEVGCPTCRTPVCCQRCGTLFAPVVIMPTPADETATFAPVVVAQIPLTEPEMAVPVEEERLWGLRWCLPCTAQEKMVGAWKGELREWTAVTGPLDVYVVDMLRRLQLFVYCIPHVVPNVRFLQTQFYCPSPELRDMAVTLLLRFVELYVTAYETLEDMNKYRRTDMSRRARNWMVRALAPMPDELVPIYVEHAADLRYRRWDDRVARMSQFWGVYRRRREFPAAPGYEREFPERRSAIQD